MGTNEKPQWTSSIEYASGETLMTQGADALHEHVASLYETALGKSLPQMEVRVNDLSINAEMFVAKEEDMHKTQELPTLVNTVKQALGRLHAKKHSVTKHVLRHVSATFKPGTMTLILGQPGSGKSALMKAIAGRFPMTHNIKMEGEITYNGISRPTLLHRLAQMVGYVPQRDVHFPTMTPKETFEFAHACCGGGLLPNAEELFSHASHEGTQRAMAVGRALEQHYPDVMIRQLGLDNCQHTIVGNAMIRGVSGGERKRVTTGEMLFGDKNVMLFDEISTGLDSAATYDIVKTQRSLVKKLHRTVVMALLQPPPEVFSLFDNVLMLDQGHVIYHGPREGIVEYISFRIERETLS